MRVLMPLACLAFALSAAGCRQAEEPDNPPIQRLAGDWAPTVLENCDLRVKFGSNSIWVIRDGKTHKISSFHRVRIDGPDMDIVLTDGDSYPLPAEKVAQAVESVKRDFRGASVLLAQPEQSLPLLRSAAR